MIRAILDPMTNKPHDLVLNSQEDFLWKVLEAACGEGCPPENVEYLCDSVEATDETDEAEICSQCYLNWAAKAGVPNTAFAKRLIEAIELACENKCPPDTKDFVCQAGEDEDTSEENCTRCLMRWAVLPFWKERD
jgi:hypothetical protein